MSLRLSPTMTRAPIVLVCAALFGCAGGSDAEAELRAWVAEAEEAAENKRRRELLDKVSTNYSDARGNDRERLGERLLVLMLKQQSVSLLTSIDRVKVFDGTAAELDVSVAMAGIGSSALDLNADAYRFELELEKEDDGWQLIAARWGEMGSDPR